MGLNIGTAELDNLMLGNQQVDRVMLGTAEVWSNKISRLYARYGLFMYELNPDTMAVLKSVDQDNNYPLIAGTTGGLFGIRMFGNSVKIDLDTLALTEIPNSTDKYDYDVGFGGTKDALFYCADGSSVIERLNYNFAILDSKDFYNLDVRDPDKMDTKGDRNIYCHNQYLNNLDTNHYCILNYDTQAETVLEYDSGHYTSYAPRRFGEIACFKDRMFVTAVADSNAQTGYSFIQEVQLSGNVLAILKEFQVGNWSGGNKITDLAGVK